jgi:hypothetical protein
MTPLRIHDPVRLRFQADSAVQINVTGASAPRSRRELTRPTFQPKTDTSAARLFFGKRVWRGSRLKACVLSVRLGLSQAR